MHFSHCIETCILNIHILSGKSVCAVYQEFHKISYTDCFQLLWGQYEPELFPGLIYRMKQPKIVLLIFVSGKIVLTGAKVIISDDSFEFSFFRCYMILSWNII